MWNLYCNLSENYVLIVEKTENILFWQNIFIGLVKKIGLIFIKIALFFTN